MALETPAWLQSGSYGAATFRQALQAAWQGSGVIEAGDLAVTENGTPNMSVNVAEGQVMVPGTLGATGGMPQNHTGQTSYGLAGNFTTQGAYYAYQDATVNLAIAAADPTNPRIDLVCASVQDSQYSGSNNQAVLQVITGTPAPSPSAPSAPASTVVLAQIAVAAQATSIVTANISSERPGAPMFLRPYAIGPVDGSDTFGSYANQHLLFQFGQATGTTSAVGALSVNFPAPFPNGVLLIVPSQDATPSTSYLLPVNVLQGSINASGCQMIFYQSVPGSANQPARLASTPVAVTYMAIGF